MRVADEQYLRVFVFEAEAGDAFLQQRHILLEVRVDQNVALRGRDQVDSQIGGPNVIKIARNPESGKLAVPIGIGLGQQCGRNGQKGKQ
jgi:hypothetical protein